ncbi:hypothetical protein F4818DRAFT_439508 [Hypoxylon cercidicola]|nr:hypothetical protein F4818DRAFT_439508 [Hypoxylon cercidicola]
MTEPYKPDDEERAEYYFGIAGNPRLVARTSHERWSKPVHEGAWNTHRRKRYLAVLEREQHEIVSRWTKDLTLALVQALNECSWTYFFPIRIGLEDTLFSEFPTILLVAVEEDTLQWKKGIAVALECRKILRDFKIANVEIEIREGKYAHFAASAEFERQIDPEAWACGQTNTLALPMLSSLGYAIGYSEDRMGEGSLGLHLKLGDKNPAVYGLTCRHVVSNSRLPSESYTVWEGHKQHHVQAGDNGFTQCLEELKYHQTDLENQIEPLQTKKYRWENWYIYEKEKEHKRPTEQETTALTELQSLGAYNQRVIDLFSKISRKKDRQIGHLAFHPKLELSSERPGYLKDWALIELDLKKFNNNPENKVFIGTEYDNNVLLKRLLNNGFLQLHLERQDLEGSSTFLVGKRGFKTGLTYGEKNSIEAVVRRHADVKEQFAWEMLIVPSRKGRVFSAKGDSGSSIFDMQGRVIGLVNGSTHVTSFDEKRGWRGIPKKYPGGTARPEKADETPSGDLVTWPDGTDVTFATPIQWVLEDIERFTGLEPRLA